MGGWVKTPRKKNVFVFSLIDSPTHSPTFSSTSQAAVAVVPRLPGRRVGLGMVGAGLSVIVRGGRTEVEGGEVDAVLLVPVGEAAGAREQMRALINSWRVWIGLNCSRGKRGGRVGDWKMDTFSLAACM